MSDFDSGDDLFDGVDADAIVQSSGAPRPAPGDVAQRDARKTPTQRLTQTTSRQNVENDDFGEGDDLFGGTTAEELLSSQPAAPGGTPSRKRSFEDEGAFGAESEHGPGSKKPRVKVEEDFEPDPKTLELARKILTEKFGHEAFRLEQEAAVARILHDRNAIVVFPTGGGKSLCYQVPALAFEELDRWAGNRGPGLHGITIVVSPLLALMKDQVDMLKRRGIAAESLDSTKTWEQQQAISAAMRDGSLRILYCAPERLNNEGFVESIKYVAGGVRLVAVDEAHCISEWGHQFRPDYLKVARFVEEINAERAICLTATATSQVVDDICGQFNVDRADVFRTSPYRPNLKLLARSVPSSDEKFGLLREFLTKHPGPSLVYVSTRDEAEKLAQSLKGTGFNARPFHAGLKTDDKASTQDAFMRDKIDIVVATIAFGMGIDKPNIRNIAHYGIPGSVEEYSQQIGRAGRDSKPSTCIFFLCPDDMAIRESFARGDTPSKRSLLVLLNDIFDSEVVALPVDGVFKKSHYYQSRECDIGMNPLGVIYASLELRYGLIRAITPEYGEYKFEPMGRYTTTIANDRTPEGRAIAEHAERAKKWCHIDVSQASRQYNLTRQDVVRRLDQLHNTGVIKLVATGLEHRYRVLTSELPRTPAEIDNLAAELLADLEVREDDAMGRIDEVIGLVTGKACFAASLARHFGMELPTDNKESCGHCSFCYDGKAVVMPPKRAEPSNQWLLGKIQAVLQECQVRDDPRFLARVAFGISSPRVTQMQMKDNKVFGSLEGQNFKVLLREFNKACSMKTDFDDVKPKTEPSSSRSWKAARGGSSSRSRGSARGAYSSRSRGLPSDPSWAGTYSGNRSVFSSSRSWSGSRGSSSQSKPGSRGGRWGKR